MPLLALWVVLATAAPAHPSLMTNEQQIAPKVTVKRGTTSLEEYRHGDPNNRVQLLRVGAQ